jgi:hypothetical protein
MKYRFHRIPNANGLPNLAYYFIWFIYVDNCNCILQLLGLVQFEPLFLIYIFRFFLTSSIKFINTSCV